MAIVTQPPILDTTGLSIVNSLDGIAEALENAGGSVVTIKAQYDESPALYSHIVDDIIYFDEHFYKVTSPISVGSSIVVGVNVVDAELDPNTPVYVADMVPIEPEQGSITLSADTASLTYEYNTATINATIVGDGAVTVSSSDSNVCTASITGTVITITAAGSGSATVTVTLADGSQYLGTTATISVTSTYVKLVSWSSGTDAEIAAMVAAADAGQLDLYEDAGWRVGDERSVTIGSIAASGTYDGVSWSVGEAQAGETATLVLMHIGLYTLTTPVLNKQGQSRSTCSFVVGLKNCLSSKGYMKSNITNLGSWSSSARRAWCNGGFRAAIPSDLRPIFKQFNVTTGTYSSTSSTSGDEPQITQDYFCLVAEQEVYGGRSYSTANEASVLTQFIYYETASNRIKKLGDSGSAFSWWDRSPIYFDSTNFCSVNVNGGTDSNAANYLNGLAPFGCI